MSQTITRLHQNSRTYDIIYYKCTKLKFIYNIKLAVSEKLVLVDYSINLYKVSYGRAKIAQIFVPMATRVGPEKM